MMLVINSAKVAWLPARQYSMQIWNSLYHLSKDHSLLSKDSKLQNQSKDAALSLVDFKFKTNRKTNQILGFNDSSLS